MRSTVVPGGRQSVWTKHRPARSGFTLIELLVVLSLVAVFAMVAIPFIRGIFIESRVPHVVNDLTLVSNQFRAQAAMALHQTSVPYANLGSSTSARATAANTGGNRFQSFGVQGSGSTATITHDIGDTDAAVLVQQAQIIQMGDAFEITLQQVHRRACPTVVQQMSKRVVTASINGVLVKPMGGSLDMSAAELACTDDNTNTFVFTFQ